MPQTFKIDQAATFEGAPVMLLSCEPKIAMGSQAQDKTKDGTPKWELQLVGAFKQFGRTTNEIIKVGVAGVRNPAEGINPYTPVELVGFTVGVMEKTRRDDKGESRVIGVQVWYRADEVRSLAATGPASSRAS